MSPTVHADSRPTAEIRAEVDALKAEYRRLWRLRAEMATAMRLMGLRMQIQALRQVLARRGD